jgi:gamma-aminobutyric acid receptor subunit alpha
MLEIELSRFVLKIKIPLVCSFQWYAMDCYFRQKWYDSRLRFNMTGLDEFSMNWLFLERVWKPDTFFMNGQKSYLHRITVPNKFLRIRSDGFLTYSMR